MAKPVPTIIKIANECNNFAGIFTNCGYSSMSTIEDIYFRGTRYYELCSAG
jgi:hypothetical protein